MSEIQVLIVDDDPKFQQLTQYGLMSHGVNTLIAHNTTQADAILKQQHVDVIICDVLMENEDGLSYCKRLRQEGQKVPLIFISSLNDPKTIRLGYEAGGSVFIVKPFNPQELHERILELAKATRVAPIEKHASDIPNWLTRFFRAAFVD